MRLLFSLQARDSSIDWWKLESNENYRQTALHRLLFAPGKSPIGNSKFNWQPWWDYGLRNEWGVHWAIGSRIKHYINRETSWQKRKRLKTKPMKISTQTK